MKRYIIRTSEGDAFNAASKARRDAETIAGKAGYVPISFRGRKSAEGSKAAALRLALESIGNWLRLLKTAEKDSIILIQYPLYPIKSARLVRWALQAGRFKGLRYAALIHDLDSVRGLHGAGARYAEQKLLPIFDAVICHNPKMKELLTEWGLEKDRIISLELFDYLTETKDHHTGEGVAIAGNLSPEKCGYVKQLVEAREVPLNLYGRGLEKFPAAKSCLRGTFSPEELPARLQGQYGLVWDGPDMDTCSGKQGEYLQYNNPHKFSLYMAAGLPVILWSRAALADFAREKGVGITIDSLTCLHERLAQVSPEVYEEMRIHAQEVGRKVRQGCFLKTALQKAEESMEGKKKP